MTRCTMLVLCLSLAATAAAAPLQPGDEVPAEENSAALQFSRSVSPFPPLPDAPEPADYLGMLEAHNRWRAEVGAAPLNWSEEVARSAQAWADDLAEQTCPMRHSSHPERRSRFGENLYRYVRDAEYPPWKRESPYVVDAWGSEKTWYDLAENRCDAPEGATCGHYTQVIWAGSRQLGCGRAHCGSSEVWVCHYYPRGNFIGLRPLDAMPWERAAEPAPVAAPEPPQAPTGFRRVSPPAAEPAPGPEPAGS